jgi:hypothetical protein
MPRSAVALQVPLNDEPVVQTVEDIDACSTVYADHLCRDPMHIFPDYRGFCTRCGGRMIPDRR